LRLAKTACLSGGPPFESVKGQLMSVSSGREKKEVRSGDIIKEMCLCGNASIRD